MEGLKDDADRVAPEARERILAERAQIRAGDLTTRPALGRSSPPSTIIKVDLPEPDGPTSPTDSPAADRQRDAAQHIDGSGRAPQCKVHVVDADERIGWGGGHGFSLPAMVHGADMAWRGHACQLHRRAMVADVRSLHPRRPSPRASSRSGDSITAGYGLAPQEALPVKLEARLSGGRLRRPSHQCRRLGRHHGWRARAPRLGPGRQAASGLCLVELGANDVLRGLDPKEAEDNLDQILARLTDAGVKTLLVGMRAPGNWGRDYQEAFDAIYPKLADKYRVPLYPFLLDGVALDPKLNQGDGLHPNAARRRW